MALGKMLNLGGIENSPPKTNQSSGRFRVARNVMPTPNGTLIPRYDWTTPSGQASSQRIVHNISDYDSDPVVISSVDVTASATPGLEKVRVYRGNTSIPFNTNIFSILDSSGNENAQSVKSFRVNDTLYFLNPYSGYFMKYDGVEIGYAGADQPVYAVQTADASGNRFLRAINHVIDFDNNEPVSEYVEINCAGATVAGVNYNVDIHLTGGTPALFTRIPSSISTPKDITGTLHQWSNQFIVSGANTYNAGTKDITVSVLETNITDTSREGSYVIIAFNTVETSTFLATLGASYSGALGIALKVKQAKVGANPLVLDLEEAYILQSSREWIEVDISADGANIAAQLTYGTRDFLSFWEGLSATAIFYFRDMKPFFPGLTSTSASSPMRELIATNGTAVASVGYDSNIFTMAPALNDWYDVTTRKVSPNNFNFAGSVPFFSFTKFQNMFLFCNDKYIWASDTYLGGWIEQLNASSFFLIGDEEFGRITAICGTSDFLFVGRERKNYYVTGNLITGNYRVQEITEAEVGPWCNNSAINIKDSVIFISATGIYQVMTGGRTTHLSAKCSKNFEDYTALNKSEDVVFEMSGYVSEVGTTATVSSNPGMSVAYDEYRELLVWMKRSSGNDCIVVHTKTGEIYEWDGMLTGYTGVIANCINFIRAEYYLGKTDQNTAPYSATAGYVSEDNSVIRSYPATNPVKLYSTWLTAGEPSLEKELLQLKLFGRIDTSSYGLKVRHYKDWDISTLITDTTYFPNNTTANINAQIQHSHKKRLNSDKCLAASVGIEIGNIDVDFEIESFEVEFNPIQSGMKK